MNARFLAAVLAAALLTHAAAAQAREQIRIVSSSTVYPFAIAVAEQFGKTSGFKTPVVEATGSGGGLKLFCDGVADTTPDIVNTSRRITPSEIARCKDHGVDDIAEVTIGYDGIILANAKAGPAFTVTRAQLYRAIAKTVPIGGKLVVNPYKKWSEIDRSLPDEAILVYGPAPNHGTRDTLVSLVMDAVCAHMPETLALSPGARAVTCGALREDGAYVDVAQNYTVILQKLVMSPAAVGILTYSYLDQNGDKIKAATIDGQTATYDNILSGRYPLSRPLFFYVKKAHLETTRGIPEYIGEFTAEKAWGKDGYLSERGLIALPDGIRQAEAAKARALPSLE
jgi:phosphate transport system substrate-binding protein